jgi:GTPase SAR1 family protein
MSPRSMPRGLRSPQMILGCGLGSLGDRLGDLFHMIFTHFNSSLACIVILGLDGHGKTTLANAGAC